MNTNSPRLTAEQLEDLRRIDACTVANAIETFRERLRNEGFADGSIACRFPLLGPVVGYAATIKIRGSAPPTAGGFYSESADWWDYILTLPAPRLVVVQDVATRIGLGSLLGAVHMNILHALGCAGALTNGAVRDLPAARDLGFQLFTSMISVSHAYVHVVEFGAPVEVAGLKIKSGDLLHGDEHGIQTIPLDIAARVPAEAARIKAREQALVALCRAPGFSVEKLRAALAKQPD